MGKHKFKYLYDRVEALREQCITDTNKLFSLGKEHKASVYNHMANILEQLLNDVDKL
jgi:hypothetical protein